MIRPQYSIVSDHASEPVTYSEVADHLRLDSNDDKSYVTALVSVAREYIESITCRAMTKATYLLTAGSLLEIQSNHNQKSEYHQFGDMSRNAAIELFRAPLISVSSVRYYAQGDQSLTTVDPSEYESITTLCPGVLYFTGNVPKIDANRPDAIQIEFIAGSGSSTTVSPMLRHCVKMMVSHLYENRSPIITGSAVSAISVPHTLDDMIKNQRVGGFFS
jgi:hypothetical protein